MNMVHLSQPPALFLAAERLSQPNNYSPPQTSKTEKLKASDENSEFASSLFHFNLPIQIINNEPAAPISSSGVFSFAKNHLKSIKTSLGEKLFNVDEHAKDMPCDNLIWSTNGAF